MKKKFRLIAVCITAILCLSAYAVSYRFQHINSEQGLPNQQVGALAQDKNGYIWIGTRNGLSKYDGYDIYTYYHNDADSNSLSHNFIHTLFIDSKQRLWVCTEVDICRYRPETNDFKCYKKPKGLFWSIVENSRGQVFFGGDMLYVYDEKSDSFRQLPTFCNGNICSLAVDKHDNLYVATNNSIFSFNASMSKITPLDKKYYADCPAGTNVIMPIFFDSGNRLWIGKNGNGLACIDMSTGAEHKYAASELSDGIIRTITEDKSHHIWLGTEKGITIINPDGTKEILQHAFHDINCLSDNAIYSILCDANQNIWIGSYFGGVDVLLHNNAQFQLFEPGINPGNIKARVARMMTEVAPGQFWIATEDGGVNIYDSKAGTFSVFSKIPKMGTNIHSVYYQKENGDMWIGTRFNGLFRYNIKTGATHKYLRSHGMDSEGVFYFARQRRGRLWVATMQGLRYYDPKTDTFLSLHDKMLDAAFIYTLFVDKDDNLWVGSANFGIFRIDAHTGRITNIRKESHRGLEDNYIISLFQDSRGTMWIGTNNNGLQYIDKQSGDIKSFQRDAILSKCTICSITEDRKGCLWISTSMGLFGYDLKDHYTIRYSTENGLPINQFNYESSLLTSGGDILLGTINGLIAFNPSKIGNTAGPLPVHFKNLIINDKMMGTGGDSPLEKCVDETERLELSYDEARSFSIEYGVIMPGNTASIEYQICLKGIDSGWRDMGVERRFYGYNMQPGTYHLMVRANNSNEGWSRCPIKAIEIVVLPPFYRSGWAYAIYFVLLCMAAWFIHRLFLIRIKEKNAVKIAQMEKEKVEEIDKAKFNFFTIVSHELKTPLSLIVAPLKSISAQELSTRTQKHLDMALKNTHKMEGLINELVTFNKIENGNFPFYIQKGNPLEFIEMASTPFREACSEKGIAFTVSCENNGEDVWFSPLYTELIVNNLLSNALKFTSEGGHVNIKAFITTLDDAFTYLCMKVSDTGIGIAKEEFENIFCRYYQTKRGYSANSSGWGIGLSLVKRLVDIHKGSASVASEIGAGSTFTVMLNVSAAAFGAQCKITDDKVIVPISQYKFQSPVSCNDGSNSSADNQIIKEDRHSILIVDDNTDMLDFLRDYFQKDYNVYTAADGFVALKIAHDESVELVVSDVMMPKMDGIELCHTLKNDMSTSHIPIILLTAKSGPDDVVNGYQSGAEAYVSKPFAPQILELQIKNIIQLIKTQQKEIVNGDGEEIVTASLSELDKEFIHKINTLVEENISNSDFAVVDITNGIGISRSLLHTKMKSLMNISMGDYIHKKRIDKACQLLKEGYNVSETAYRTGFSDPNYFSKAFKKNMGKSPSEYVNEHNK